MDFQGHKVPKRHHKKNFAKYHKDTHRCQQAQLDKSALGRVPGGKKHIQTARGRVLAAGEHPRRSGCRLRDDPPWQAARRNPVAKGQLGFEVQVTRSLFVKTNNWLLPLPLVF